MENENAMYPDNEKFLPISNKETDSYVDNVDKLKKIAILEALDYKMDIERGEYDLITIFAIKSVYRRLMDLGLSEKDIFSKTGINISFISNAEKFAKEKAYLEFVKSFDNL